MSLDDYIARMKDGQDTILYLPGESKDAIMKSPILKKYQKLGYEVLLFDDPVDEFVTQHLTEYEKKKIKSIAKADLDVLDGADDIAKKKLEKLGDIYKPLTDWWHKYLGPKVEKVQVSNKLDDDPLFITTSQYGFSASMEKIQRMQAFGNNQANYMHARKTLEINPHHSIMKDMLAKVNTAKEENEKQTDQDRLDENTEDMATLMFNMALLNSGFMIDEPVDLTAPLQRMINVGFGFAADAPVEEIEVELDEEKEEPEDEAAPDADLPEDEPEEINLDDLKAADSETPAEGVHDDL